MARPLAIAFAAAIAAGLVWGGWMIFGPGAGDELAACRAQGGGTVGADIGGDFALTAADDGRRVTPETLIDKPTLIYFGYTFCPDFCPLDGVNMAEAKRLLADRGVAVNVVFVTIDPARDDAERLDAYTDNLHPEMIGLTGTESEIAEAARAYRVYYARADDDPEFYLMDHSTFTYLMAPEVGFLDFFRHGTPPEDIADRVACYIEALS